jgi:hypothetical protein
MVLKVSAKDFLILGLDLTGFTTAGAGAPAAEDGRPFCAVSTSIRRFRAAFGASPESCCKIFADLQTIEPATRMKHNAAYFLMTLQWLSTYMVEEILAGIYKLSEKTVRKWIWDYTKAIQALKEQKVRSRELTGKMQSSLFSLPLLVHRLEYCLLSAVVCGNFFVGVTDFTKF